MAHVQCAWVIMGHLYVKYTIVLHWGHIPIVLPAVITHIFVIRYFSQP